MDVCWASAGCPRSTAATLHARQTLRNRFMGLPPPSRMCALVDRLPPSAGRGKVGWPLLADGLETLADVLAHERQHLEGDRLVEDGAGHAQPVVQGPLGPAD